MDNITLTNLFDSHNKRAIDFIRWVESNYGVTITRSELSLHMSGKRGINRWAAVLSTIYFENIANEDSEK